MSVQTLPQTTAPALPIGGDAALMVREIEQYLAARVRTTAHPLVTKTTDQLVAEALAALDQAPAADVAAAPTLTPPSRFVSRLPGWVLALPTVRAWHGGGRSITAAESLELTALVIERFGWHQGDLRGDRGERCILGAQTALLRLGYGDVHTLRSAAAYLQHTLGDSAGAYTVWNDASGRTLDQVLGLVREAAAAARRDGR